MSGLFGTFNIAVKGLNANQTALHTTSHNISNINTQGFSRQRVELKTDTAYNLQGVGQLGSGVKIDSVVRLVDDFVNLQLRKENSTLSEFVVKSDVMSQIESIFNEPSDTGLNFAMGEMFNSWQELAKNPESLNSKTIVVEKAKTFTDTLNHMTSKIVDLKNDTINNIDKNVLDFNSLGEQLNTVNEQIFNVTIKGQSPNDLMDQRDELLNQMSGLATTKDSFDKWGRAKVEVGGVIVTGEEAKKTLSTLKSITKNEDDPANVFYTATVYEGGDYSKVRTATFTEEQGKDLNVGSSVFYEGDETTGTGTKATISSGKIGGYQSTIKEMDGRLVELKNFAGETAKMFNNVHNVETGDKDFFEFIDEGEGFTLEVNLEIRNDMNLVRTKKDSSTSEGDGSRALAIANLRFEKNTSGQTLEGSYGDVVTKVGISVQQAVNMVGNQEAVLSQLNNRRESISGVSLDEEVTNLVKFQRSYEANSRVINTINEMLDTLINRTGV